MAITTTVTCTCGSVVSAEGKVVHFCAQRSGRTVVSREHVGFFDGRPICYRALSATSASEVQAELDAYVYELLQDTAVETADIEADAAAEQDECRCNGWGCRVCEADQVYDMASAREIGPPACIGAFPGVTCTNVADITGFCPPCQAALTRIGHAARLLSERHTRDVHTAVMLQTPAQRGCASCGAASDAALCRACAETGEYCGCGAPAVQWLPVGRGLVQPVCNVCADGLLFAPVVRRVLEAA